MWLLMRRFSLLSRLVDQVAGVVFSDFGKQGREAISSCTGDDLGIDIGQTNTDVREAGQEGLGRM